VGKVSVVGPARLTACSGRTPAGARATPPRGSPRSSRCGD
jgi:hypothetical protein